MSHDQGDNITGLLAGSVTALLAMAGEWAQASTWAGDALHTVLFGLLGGAAGFVGKKLIERATTKRN